MSVHVQNDGREKKPTPHCKSNGFMILIYNVSVRLVFSCELFSLQKRQVPIVDGVYWCTDNKKLAKRIKIQYVLQEIKPERYAAQPERERY